MSSTFHRVPETDVANGILRSIVMVHGLSGDCFATWTKNGCFWLRDLLPSKFPNARILTFGYNADLAMNYSTYDLRDHAIALLTSLRDKREQQHVSPRY